MIDFLFKYKELIVVFSGIGTFISALIAIFTLGEVKKQRLSLYKPDILLKSFIVSISKSPLQKEDEELIEYRVSDFNDYSKNHNQNQFEVSAKYKVDNLGFGVAKNIKCQWQFDTKKDIKMIENLLPKQYQFHWHESLNLYFLDKVGNENFHYSAFGDISLQEIDYISPISVQKHNHYHTIPGIIIFAHYLFLIFKNNLIGKECENFHLFKFSDFKFPNPILKLEFRDLNGKKYKNEYTFTITAVVTQIEDIMDLTKEFAYLEFELL
jgi:hypothetical protein